MTLTEANTIYTRAIARAKQRAGNEERAVLAEMILMVLKDPRLDEALLMTARPAPLHLVTGRRV